MKPEYKIALLTPTRGRTDALGLAVKSMIERADNPETIQVMLGFDNDDTVGLEYFEKELQPWMDDNNVNYTAIEFERMGYQGLNQYYNELARHTDSEWLFGWSDDSIMDTQGWDTEIARHDGEFKLLKVHTHNEHPYSIFPIWPRAWYDLFGHVSRHQMIDAELSQMAYMLDLVKIIDINVTHDRADLTGNNLDDTQKSKVLFEGNPQNPYDFHNPNVTNRRLSDCEIIARYLAEQGHDISFWENVKTGKQDPWEKLKANDVNKQMVQFHMTR